MKMIIFRPTFVSAVTMLSMLSLFCALMTSVSAAPQFTNWNFHTLDELPAGDADAGLSVDPSASPALVDASLALPTATADVVPSELPAANDGAQTSGDDPVDATDSTPDPDTSSDLNTTVALAQTNGASHLLGSVNVAIVLSVAVSAAFTIV